MIIEKMRLYEDKESSEREKRIRDDKFGNEWNQNNKGYLN